jgi:hypothetical protein
MCDLGFFVIIIVQVNPFHKYVTCLKKQEGMVKKKVKDQNYKSIST